MSCTTCSFNNWMTNKGDVFSHMHPLEDTWNRHFLDNYSIQKYSSVFEKDLLCFDSLEIWSKMKKCNNSVIPSSDDSLWQRASFNVAEDRKRYEFFLALTRSQPRSILRWSCTVDNSIEKKDKNEQLDSQRIMRKSSETIIEMHTFK